MIHPITPPVAETLEELGIQLARMRYDAEIVVFRSYMIEKRRQATRDVTEGHRKLSRFGFLAGAATEVLLAALERMLRASVHYMEEELKAQPLLIDLP